MIQHAKRALLAEIEAVQKFPSKEILNPESISEIPGSASALVRFDHVITSLKFVEECKAHYDGKTVKVKPHQFKEHSMDLIFDGIPEKTIESIELEWENDFILKKTLHKLENLEDQAETGLLKSLFAPQTNYYKTPPETEVYHDSSRNNSQIESIEKALHQPVSFVWGPPGTGKTSTLGFIIANYLMHGKKVLFASNTNRAVDVGLLSVIEAMNEIGVEIKPMTLTRFGDSALDDEQLLSYSFTKHMEDKLEERKKKAIELAQLLERHDQFEKNAEELLSADKPVPDDLETQLIIFQQKIQDLGGRKVVEEKLENSFKVYEHLELARFNCISATLAKVCTSELLESAQFDAVVIDEASMANIPYLMVLASKATQHIVLVGDPMQLPPISITDKQEERLFLEKDMFTFLSGANTVNDLFQWHDSYPEFTSFFDTQYRLNLDLAELVSSTFYEGRLKTAGKWHISGKDSSFKVLDSSLLSPQIIKKPGDGFRPLNPIHIDRCIEQIWELVRSGYRPEQIGIIVPFRSVVWDYRKLLNSKGFNDVEIGTIHTFQGREKEIIIFDTVMSAERENNRERHYTVRPFDELKSGIQVPRLLNVAFSRSKDRFYVIADMNHINRVYRNKFLGKLLNRMIN